MIAQNIGNVQLIYVDDYRVGYRDVMKKFGMIDESGSTRKYVSVEESNFINANGISMPAFHLVGRTVDLYVVNRTIDAKIENAESLCRAINYFPNAVYRFKNFVFSGKFRANSVGTMADGNGRKMTITDTAVKDLAGIYDLMCHLDLNNGKLFEPLLARYVYATREVQRRKLQVVGYFDLSDYLHIIKSDKAMLFNRETASKSDVYMKIPDTGRVSITIKESNSGNAVIDIVGPEQIYDLKKANAFHPYVIMTLAPLKIATMKFPWQKVSFDRTTVFMTPMMTSPDAWGTLQGGLDLLAKKV